MQEHVSCMKHCAICCPQCECTAYHFIGDLGSVDPPFSSSFQCVAFPACFPAQTFCSSAILLHPGLLVLCELFCELLQLQCSHLSLPGPPSYSQHLCSITCQVLSGSWRSSPQVLPKARGFPRFISVQSDPKLAGDNTQIVDITYCLYIITLM